MMIAETQSIDDRYKRGKCVSTSTIQIKHPLNEWSFDWINGFNFSFPVVKVPDWRREWIKSLTKAAVEPFAGFFLQVADEVRCDDGLDISRESASAGLKVHTFGYKTNIDPCINELSEISPISKISGTTVNLVNDETA